MRALVRMFSKHRTAFAVVGLPIIAFVVGLIIGESSDNGAVPIPTDGAHAHGEAVAGGAKTQTWTCSMHPQVRQPKPGQCPICGMDLIPVEGEQDDAAGARELSLSETARKLAEVQVSPVERAFVTAEIRLVGKVAYDEARVAHISAWVPGRLDQLFADYTGVAVREGDHLVYLYSPELLTAQQELIQALKTAGEFERRGQASIGRTAWSNVEAAREKLRLWGLTNEQVREIEHREEPSDHLTINAPISGIVVHKNAVAGMYVKTGTRIYTIADLSQVWVKLDAYESDLPWIRYGQDVELSTEAYPGEVFSGKVVFIDPIVDAQTRTVKVRLNVPNLDGRLKPQMFVHAVIHAKMASGGRVMDAALAGKWISPMHPEVVKDEPGSCDVGGMPLVRAETLGYAAFDETDAAAPLIIPASAPLITGKRAVVYVAVPDQEGVYEGREITLGPRAGNSYVVRAGLEEGELVVVRGNFKIDSALQILAKPSMMSPSGEGGGAGLHAHGAHGTTTPARADEATPMGTIFESPEAFRTQLGVVFAGYFATHRALSQDDLDAARSGAQSLVAALENVDMQPLSHKAHQAWMRASAAIAKSAKHLAATREIEEARGAFALLSESLTGVARRFGGQRDRPILRYHCPMAFDGRGADWLQDKEGTENPYYGSAMFKCGSQVESVWPRRTAK